MNLTFYDIIGLCGVCCSLYAYARVQWQRDFAKRLSYSVLNFCGSSMLLVSLSHHFNLASVLINMIWCLLSIYGICRCLKYMRAERAAAMPQAAAE